MANDKNNINELVADDEDSTAELEAVTFRRDHTQAHAVLQESDENTSDFTGHQDSKSKTIGRLQYDIEQLRAKWTGLESELSAREELTDNLNTRIDELGESHSRKVELLKARDRKIKTLKAEIRSRDEHHRIVTTELQQEIEATRHFVREIPEPPLSARIQDDAEKDENRLARAEVYADTLRRKLQDVLGLQDDLRAERGRLFAALAEAAETNQSLGDAFAEATTANQQLEEKLATIQDKHEEELRILRFELGEAQETATHSEELNSQLTSDLVDTRDFKASLERRLSDNDEQSRQQIERLEKELAGVKIAANDFEQKLEARSDTINVLLSELARKSDQIESIGEIGDVISDIDVRISEQFDDMDEGSARPQKPPERVARVLVGKLGDKLLRFPLFKDRLTIGRTEDNDIQLNAAFISRKHAVVQADGDATRVIDWGSKNGVYVNSKRITEHFLKNGDILTIGNAHFRFEERPKRDS